MNLENLDLAGLLPAFMRGDKANVALADAVSKVIQEQSANLDKLSTWGQLGKLSVSELDDLADELNIFWYDRSLADDQKRVLIAKSDKVYMHLGTKSAVMQVVNDIFGEASIDEFFEYGGLPHHFRIRVTDINKMTPETEAKFMRVLGQVKRKSQWLESIQNELFLTLPIFVGMSVAVHSVTAITMATWQDNIPGVSIKLGGGMAVHQAGSESNHLNIK